MTSQSTKSTDVRVTGVELYLLPVYPRVPLKFGRETLTFVNCARVRVTVTDRSGGTAEGWGETPLSVQWAWPSTLDYEPRRAAMEAFCQQLGPAWAEFDEVGHALEVGHAFLSRRLPELRKQFDRHSSVDEPLPLLAGLVCCSAFDVAMHDAYGKLVGRPVYETYNKEYMNRDLSHYLEPADDAATGAAAVDFHGKYPADYLVLPPKKKLPVWHLVGGLDPLQLDQLSGNEPDDGEPVLLADWIERDGLHCFKVKLRGDDAEWDYDRLVQVARIAARANQVHLTADFNCTVTDPEYVNRILDRLAENEPTIYRQILYVEQPFPYDLEANPIDVRSVAERKPLLMDESAHDWQLVRLGRSLGWTGVALKTCKTQTGALLSLSWARSHGMQLMVQDLTNPMLAQIPHVLLAAHADTMMGVESNASQFYPAASSLEAAVHPGVFRRRDGQFDLSTLGGPGFGYRVEQIGRTLPPPAGQWG